MTDVLVLSNRSDYSLDRVVHWLAQNEPALRVQRINREDRAPLGELTAVLGPRDWTVDNCPRAVWLRQLLPERDPYGPSPEPEEIDDILVERRQWLAWLALLRRLGVRWLNDPSRVNAAESKVDQLAVATRIGFEVPRTMLTCHRAGAEAFVADVGPCVIKSLTTAFWEFSDQSFVFTTRAEEALAADEPAWNTQPVLERAQVGDHPPVVVLARLCCWGHLNDNDRWRCGHHACFGTSCGGCAVGCGGAAVAAAEPGPASAGVS